MAYVKPYGSSKPPISAHPAFPVIVGLWFAALFGMGSLVLPNILIERLLTMSGMASLVPAAAPPLGITARIAISSGAALFGAILGFIIALRVTRAQATVRTARIDRNLGPRQAHAGDNGARRPISAREELGSTALETPPQPAIPGRRRALAMQEDNRPSTYLQPAPVPGTDERWDNQGSEPHPMMPSVDVVARRQAAEREGVKMRRPMQPEEGGEPLDLASFEEPQAQQPAPDPRGETELAALRNRAPQQFERPETVAPSDNRTHFERQDLGDLEPIQDFGQRSPMAKQSSPPQATEFPAAEAPDFSRPAAPSLQDFARPAPPAAPAEEPVMRQEFVQPEPLAPAPRQDFARPAEQSADDPMAPFRAPTFDDQSDEDEEILPFGASAFRQAQEKQPVEEQSVPQVFVPIEAPVAADEEDEPLAFFAPSQAKPAAAAAELLESLGMVELAERLANSLARKDRPTAPPPAALVEALNRQAATSAPASAAEDAEPAVPAAFAAPVAAAPEPQLEAVPTPLFDSFTQAETARPFEQPAQSFAPPPPPVIPEALRPISLELEEFGEEEGDEDLEFGLPSMPAAAAPEPESQATRTADFSDASDFAPTAEDDLAFDRPDPEEDDELDDDVATEGYSSLLAMRHPFRSPAEYVRIDMPEPNGQSIEPAVVFPGQAAKARHSETELFPSRPFAAPNAADKPQAAAASNELEPRRFDAPPQQAQPVASVTNRPRADRDEAERALRSALSTLQRMSGAA